MQGNIHGIQGDIEFSRSNQLFTLKIPTYVIVNNIVYYYIQLRDLTTGQIHVSQCRFKEIKQLHQALSKLKVKSLPLFPKTHFRTRTNQDPQLIKERKKALQAYLGHVINDPALRGYPQVKAICRMCKRESNKRRGTVIVGGQELQLSRAKSQGKTTSSVLSREEWRRFNPKGRRASLLR